MVPECAVLNHSIVRLRPTANGVLGRPGSSRFQFLDRQTL